MLVETGQLGPGVRQFAPHEVAGGGRVGSKVDYAGQLGDLGATRRLRSGQAQGQRWSGRARIARRTGSATGYPTEKAGPDRFSHRVWISARKAFAPPASIGTDEDRDAVPMDVGDLGEGRIEDRDVIGGVSAPAMPDRSSPDTVLLVFAGKHSNGCSRSRLCRWAPPALSRSGR